MADAGPAADGGLPDAPAGDADAAAVAHDLGHGGDFRAYADQGAAALQAQYDQRKGLFPSTGWWNSANALTALIHHALQTGSTTHIGAIANTFDRNSGGGFLNLYFDDEAWWALAWIDAYDLTKEARYLQMAKSIFADLVKGWDGTCGGGVWWTKERTYKNAITNELFLLAAARLHQRTPGDSGAGSYGEWATRAWSWFEASGMINGDNLVNDGLKACKNNGDVTWTYNQGVLIGGLVELSKIRGDQALLARAQAIADATFTKLVDDQGVLREPCEGFDGGCGADGWQFKGIFMRHLSSLAAATKEPRNAAFITRNADWLWNASRKDAGSLGGVWSRPFDAADAARQSSALDALNAAIPFTAPQTNLAASKAATANATCAAGEGAEKAVDGTVGTKWCGGETSGRYWLQVDLGAVVSVGRIVLRHAAAGGESLAFNSKDFDVETSVDAASWDTLASVKSNTRSVTVHRTWPAVDTRYVRVTISTPQSGPDNVAARIAELEAYAR